MKGFWNIPNTLSIIRVALVPCFVVAFFLCPQELFYVPLIIFVVASLTDVVDGFIARKANMITKYGVVLDPLADKLLKIAVLLCFGIAYIIPLWISICMVSLDIAMIVTGIFLFKKQITIPSNLLGKLGTVIVSCGIVLCFFADYLEGWHRIVLYAGLITVITASLAYVLINFKSVSEKVFGKKRKSTALSNRPTDEVSKEETDAIDKETTLDKK